MAIATAGVAGILAAMLIGPSYAPAVFDWMRHTTSEQAGQNMPGAWIMRAGFVAYGLGTLTAIALTRTPRPVARAALAVFGAGLIGTALWSNLPVDPALQGDQFDNWLHSIASGIVGTGFAAACAARLFLPGGTPRDALAWGGLVVAVLVPLAMGAVPEFRGLLQRLMFVYSFAFVLREVRQGGVG